MAGETVVITGAAGFLGFHTIKLLISRDPAVSEIRAYDVRRVSKTKRKLIEEELEQRSKQVTRNEKSSAVLVKWIQADIRDVNQVERALDGADCVIHCAAKIDLLSDERERNEAELKSVNVDGTETLLKASCRLGVARFIHVSSFEVYTSFDTIYYATENTLPKTKWWLFGSSGRTKADAECLVKTYANRKLDKAHSSGEDALNVICVRFPPIYGQFDRHYVSNILAAAECLGGSLTRVSNIWIRQQPIHVTNAAWSLVKARQTMVSNRGVSGEEFHITDDTPIADPFDFVQPFLEARGLKLAEKASWSYPVLWLLLYFGFGFARLLRRLDVFGLVFGSNRKSRLQEAIERDSMQGRQEGRSNVSGDQETDESDYDSDGDETSHQNGKGDHLGRTDDNGTPHRDEADRDHSVFANEPDNWLPSSSHSADLHPIDRLQPSSIRSGSSGQRRRRRRRWHDYVTPASLTFMCNSSFLNRTKASLRFNYEPILEPADCLTSSLDFYSKRRAT